MKVIYARRMTDRIIEAIDEAHSQRREIERVELTPDEYDQLQNEMDYHCLNSGVAGWAPPPGHRWGVFSGVQVQDFEGEK